MGNDSAPECLNHKDNRNVQVRLDYILLYMSEIKAKIIRILETWTNTKYAEWYKSTADSQEQERKPPEEDLWVTMSYDQFSIFLFGTAQHDSVKQYIDELVASGDIQRRLHPEYPYGPPQYLLNLDKLQNALNTLEIPLNIFDLSPRFIAPRKKHTPLEKSPPGRGTKPRGGVGKIPPGRGENTPPSKNLLRINSELPNNQDTEESRHSEIPPTDPSDFASASSPLPVVDNVVNNATTPSSKEGMHTPGDFLPGDEPGAPAPPVALPSLLDVGAEDVYVPPEHGETNNGQQSDTASKHRWAPHVDSPPAGERDLTPQDTHQETLEQIPLPARLPSDRRHDGAATGGGSEPRPSDGKQPKKPKRVLPEGPPVMPADDAPWPDAETMVQIVEARKKRRYGDTTRAQELSEARKVLALLKLNGIALSRKRFTEAWDDVMAWPFWKEHTKVKPMIRTLRKDDKILSILEELDEKEARGGASPPPNGRNPPPPPPPLVIRNSRSFNGVAKRQEPVGVSSS